MLSMRFSQLLRSGCMLLTIGALHTLGQNSGPKIYSAAMSMDYNPLLWQGDDAQFALDMLHSSHCTAEASRTAATKTQNQALQTVAVTIAHEQGKLYRQLRGMARTFNFRLPRKRDLDDCPLVSRIAELSGQEMDSVYISFLLKRTTANVSRFEAEVAMPRLPSNWTLWGLAKKDLPMIRSEEAAAAGVRQPIASHE
jgi:predicted outer membrane protein